MIIGKTGWSSQFRDNAHILRTDVIIVVNLNRLIKEMNQRAQRAAKLKWDWPKNVCRISDENWDERASDWVLNA